jgi:hypothetical protein
MPTKFTHMIYKKNWGITVFSLSFLPHKPSASSPRHFALRSLIYAEASYLSLHLCCTRVWSKRLSHAASTEDHLRPFFVICLKHICSYRSKDILRIFGKTGPNRALKDEEIVEHLTRCRYDDARLWISSIIMGLSY